MVFILLSEQESLILHLKIRLKILKTRFFYDTNKVHIRNTGNNWRTTR